jgi:Asp-tRNA(Asn)/Glu-tRNA(Gln) amidotransferase A subunit family amidase
VRVQGRTFHLVTASITDIQEAVDAGALDYERLVRLYLNRIEAYDKRGPQLRAVLAVHPDAIQVARSLDQERRSRGRRSPLHGIPVAVKDNIDALDMPTTGGNPALAGTYAVHDATAVRKLRAAGAIILMKTNLDELALGSRGLSSLGGQILNPYDLTRNPGGSSGGTAVAVNVGFATVGLGTETGFSIRRPASNNALVGIAPSRGLISRAGVIPISFTQDRVGVHAKTVADAALVLGVISGFDADDLATAALLKDSPPISFVPSATRTLQDARIGVLRDLFRSGGQFEEANQIVEQQITLMRQRGASVKGRLTTGLDLIGLMPSLRVNSDELQTAFDSYLRRRGPDRPIPSFAALVATGKYLRGTTLESRFKETIALGPPERNEAYLSRLERQRRVHQSLVDLMNRENVEALVYPVKSLPAPPIGLADDGVRDNNISAVTGLPAVVLPAGVNAAGLPIAIEILGRPFSESRLIEIAGAYEQSRGPRVSPKATPPLPGDVFSF